jgi:hypothetical protein
VDLRVRWLGPNSFGEELAPGAVEDCYLGLLVDQPLAATLPAPGSLVVVGPAAVLNERVRQPDGRAVYDLLTGHPDRSPRELVFVADLAVELHAWQDTDFAHQGIDVDGVAEAITQLARRGQVRARWYHELSAWDAKALGASGDGLRPRRAARPAQQLAGRAVPALAAPDQRTPPGRRAVPVGVDGPELTGGRPAGRGVRREDMPELLDT